MIWPMMMMIVHQQYCVDCSYPSPHYCQSYRHYYHPPHPRHRLRVVYYHHHRHHRGCRCLFVFLFSYGTACYGHCHYHCLSLVPICLNSTIGINRGNNRVGQIC